VGEAQHFAVGQQALDRRGGDGGPAGADEADFFEAPGGSPVDSGEAGDELQAAQRRQQHQVEKAVVQAGLIG
jgi:hypothetical protein